MNTSYRSNQQSSLFMLTLLIVILLIISSPIRGIGTLPSTSAGLVVGPGRGLPEF